MISIAVLIILGLAVVGLVGALFYSISRNIRQGRAARIRLAERLRALRLHRALGLFGIDLDAYLHTQRLVDVERHMRACSACKETERCDTALQGGAQEDLGFCANREDLARIGGPPRGR